MSYVAIKAIESTKLLTVSDVEDTKVELCDSDNCDDSNDIDSTSQIWILDGSVIKWAERPCMYLGLNDVGELQLKRHLDEGCYWTFKSSKISLKSDPSISLTMLNNSTIISTISTPNGDPILWDFIPAQLPQPATSCHLRYGIENGMLPEWIEKAKKWTLQCDVRVRKLYFQNCDFAKMTNR